MDFIDTISSTRSKFVPDNLRVYKHIIAKYTHFMQVIDFNVLTIVLCTNQVDKYT